MKKKILLAIALSACSVSTVVNAGGMGPLLTKPAPYFVPFLAGEGMYTWPEIDGYRIRVTNIATSTGTESAVFTSQPDNKGWGGRLAVGMMHFMSGQLQPFAGSVEAGWGYYGKVNLVPRVTVSSGVQVIPSGNSISASTEQYGVDLLAGLIYDQPMYDVFVKVGALIQNLKFRSSINPDALASGRTSTLLSRLDGTYTPNLMAVNVLPMIRLGGGYHVDKQWLVTASWMHAFGSTLSITAPDINFGTGNTLGGLGRISAQVASPTLNTVMFGIEYRFT